MGNAVGVKPGVLPGTGVAPSLAVSGGRSADERVHPEPAKPKKVDLKAFKAWLEKVKRRPAREDSEAFRYQRKHAGPEEVQVSGGGQQVWADGARPDSARVVEVKHVGDSAKSPFIPGSKCDEGVRLAIQTGVIAEFERYAAVIKDPNNPIVALEVIVNDGAAVPFFRIPPHAVQYPRRGSRSPLMQGGTHEVLHHHGGKGISVRD